MLLLKRFVFGLVFILVLALGARWVSRIATNLSFIPNLNQRLAIPSWQLAQCGSHPDIFATTLGLTAVQLDPGESSSWRAYGLGLWFAGNCTGAVESLKRAGMSSDPRAQFAQINLGQAYLSLGDYSLAVAELKKTDAANYLTTVAQDELSKGEKNSATSLYQLAFDIKPMPDAAGALAEGYVEKNQIPQAVDTWMRMAKAYDEDDQYHWLALGEAARLQKNWDTARIAFNRAADLSADPFNLLLRTDRMLFDAKDYSGVIVVSEKLIQLKPSATSEPYTLAAKAETELGNYEAAVNWCDRAAALLRDDPWPDYIAGMVYLQAGDLNRAEARFVRAENIDPQNFSANLQLGLLKYKQGDIPNAILSLERIASSSGDCDVIQMLGEWYAELSNQDRSSYYINLWNVQCKR